MSTLVIPRVPTSGLTPEVRAYLEQLNIFLTRELNARVPDLTGKDAVLLVSPDGSVYNVTVSDLGVLTTTLVFG
jgi:hypothetical protein